MTDREKTKKEQQIEEMSQDFIKLQITTRQGVEAFAKQLYDMGYRKETQFTQNMKNVLEIEKKNAVKEFAEKLKEKAHKGASRDAITYKFIEFDYTITESALNELLKEYEK